MAAKQLGMGCVFCDIVADPARGACVYETPDVLAFLDIKPLFPGHVLVVPKRHAVTLTDLLPSEIEPLFTAVQRVAKAVPAALGSQGTFMANNNTVSQTVFHLHIHVVPRTKGDGLKGFFWPRNPYRDAAHMEEVRAALALKLSH